MSQNNHLLHTKALQIHHKLVTVYGQREWRPRFDPLSELIFTILSQNTSDVNRDRAHARLVERFPTWEAVRDADVHDLAEAIRPGGLADIKAPRIQAVLRRITAERGELNLDFLADLPLDEARAWLTSLEGIGPKTAAIVLLFSLGKPAFPVDTHVHRVTRRLGLIGPKTSAEKAHRILEELIPPEAYFTFHLNLIGHGRQVCKAQRPRCEHCVLASLCDYPVRLSPDPACRGVPQETEDSQSVSDRDQIHIGKIIRDAVVFDFKNWVGDPPLTNPDALLEVVPRLFALLDERKVDYVVVGGIALLTYVPGRNTQDIDLIMALPSLSKLPEIKIKSQEQDSVRGEFEGLQIDVLLTRNPLFAKVQREYTAKQKFMEREMPIATVEGLVLLKLYALPSLYRQGDFVKVGLYENDIATLMHYHRPSVPPLLEELTEHLGEGDVAELREIVREIEQRIERFRKGAERRQPC